jgi:hypothetical protein
MVRHGGRGRSARPTVAAVIRSTHSVAAPASIAHAVLTDLTAWRLWSPHVQRVEAASQVIESAGWTGTVKPWFGPATTMEVTWCEPGRGIRWTSTAAAHRLDYADLIEPDSEGRCTVTMTAQVSGPAGALVETVAAPLSAYGQRRRLARLAALAEFLHRRAIVYAT